MCWCLNFLPMIINIKMIVLATNLIIVLQIKSGFVALLD